MCVLARAYVRVCVRASVSEFPLSFELLNSLHTQHAGLVQNTQRIKKNAFLNWIGQNNDHNFRADPFFKPQTVFIHRNKDLNKII